MKKFLIIYGTLFLNMGILFSQPVKIDRYGQIFFRPYNITNAVLFTEDYNEPQIVPSKSGTGYLGTYYQYWYRTYSYYVHRYIEYTLSDTTVKTNIKKLNSSLDKLMNVDVISFDYSKKAFNNENPKKLEQLTENGKNCFGFKAQQLETIFPNLVKKEDNGLLYVNENGLIPVIVKSMKEQQEIIEVQNKKINELDKRIQKIEKTSNLKSSKNYNPHINTEISGYLFQNSPNPFNEKTEISFYIIETANNAILNIYNLQGNQIKSYSIFDRGKSSIVINGSDLHAGIYYYTLIIDNQEIDSKRMILTD